MGTTFSVDLASGVTAQANGCYPINQAMGVVIATERSAPQQAQRRTGTQRGEGGGAWGAERRENRSVTHPLLLSFFPLSLDGPATVTLSCFKVSTAPATLRPDLSAEASCCMLHTAVATVISRAAVCALCAEWCGVGTVLQRGHRIHKHDQCGIPRIHHTRAIGLRGPTQQQRAQHATCNTGAKAASTD